MTFGLSRGMNGVTLPIVTLGTIRPEDSGAAQNATEFSNKLYSETQVSSRLGMSGGRSPRHAKNPLSGRQKKTLSITHHTLSPPPSHHHLYIIHLIKWLTLQRFYRITMSLKRPFVPKSDVKQWFTTTTTTGRPGASRPGWRHNPRLLLRLAGDKNVFIPSLKYPLNSMA